MNARVARDLEPGTLVDRRYRLEAPIAHGGMSTVYLATDERLERHVALKLLSASLADDPSFINRLELEAKSVARLSHPGVVQVYDQGVDDDHAFLVMELVPGGTLREVVNERGPMPAHVVLSVLRPILGALDDAHRNGLIHRDIKPENILVSATGAVKLGDFGLVRAVAEARSTSQNIVMGTAAYLAPEQIATGDTDPRSDLYSLGVVAFELLTGQVPFQGDTPVATAYQRLERNVPPPSRLMPGIPEDLDDLILHATERNLAARIPSAREFLRRVEAVAARNRLHNVVVPAPSRSAWTKARERAAAEAKAREGSGETVFDIASRESARESSKDVPAGERAEWGKDYTPDSGGGEWERDQTSVMQGRSPSTDHTRRHVAGAAAAGPAAPGPTPAPGHDAQRPPLSPAPHTRRMPAAPPGAGPTTRTMPAQPQPVPGQHPTATYHGGAPAPTPGEAGTAPAPVPPPEGLGRRRTGLGCLWLALLAIVAVVLAVAGWWIGSGRMVAIPDTRGMSVEQATAQITSLGLLSATIEAYDNDIPAEEVIGSDPGSGDKVAPGSTVTLQVSAGVPVVPELGDNRSRGYVEQILADRTLVPVAGESVHSDDVAKGQVVSLEPGPGTAMQVGDSVTMTFSSGPAPVRVPDVIGLSEDDARAALEQAGLRVGAVEHTYDEDVAAGTVAAMSPEPDETVDRTSAIDLTISTATRVPDVSGLPLDEAKQRLEEAGLTVVVGDAETDDQVLAGDVIRTEPAAGKHVDASSDTVRLIPSDAIEVPVVLGRSVDDAKTTLREAGLQVEVVSGRNGFVYAQSPRPGKIVGPETTVEISAVG